MHTKNIEYKDDSIILEGYFANDESKPSPKPAVVVVHDWTGRNDFACKKAEDLAELGYVGFAMDMYGKGIQGKNIEEKKSLIKPFMENRALLQQRMRVALETLREQTEVDKNKIAVIGFCFGGLCALDLARTGADINAAVSFHGLLMHAENIPNPTIHAKILALHGFDDPMAPSEQVFEFEQEMRKANADWQIHVYGNTMHAFTNPQANDPDFGTVYNKLADKRSWQALKNFLMEVFQ